MLDPLFVWLESSAVSIWLTESPSIFAFPFVLVLHTLGLGVLAGLNAALDFRLMGVASQIPLVEFRRFLPIMGFGFCVNAVTGVLLVIAYPTKALTNPVFYLKLGLIALALTILLVVRRRVLADETTTTNLTPGKLKMLATASLFCWTGAIVAGRLLAYTYTRLTAS